MNTLQDLYNQLDLLDDDIECDDDGDWFLWRVKEDDIGYPVRYDHARDVIAARAVRKLKHELKKTLKRTPYIAFLENGESTSILLNREGHNIEDDPIYIASAKAPYTLIKACLKAIEWCHKEQK